MANEFGQVVVFGAGAVGSWLGARLRPPALLVAREAHVEAIRSHGLRITGLEDDIVRLAAETTCPDLAADALVLVAVKSPDLAEAAAALRGRLAPDTVVAVLSNGLEPDRVLGDALDRPVVRIIAQFGAVLAGPGRVESYGGRVRMGTGSVEDRIAVRLETTGLPIDRDPDIRRLSWEKLAMNCVANPLCALTDRRNRAIVTEDLRALRHGVVAEVAALAETRGLHLPEDLAGRIDAALAASGNLNSMVQDLHRGRSTEIESLNGYVERASAEAGLAAPLNRLLAGLIRLRERPSSATPDRR